MQQRFNIDVEADTDKVFAIVADLGHYDQLLDIVHQVNVDHGQADDSGPTAWLVTLRAKIGPFARSKRLRMTRTVHEPNHVRFERTELDGRDHSPWVLTATIEPAGSGSHVTMSLDYGGRLWIPALDGLLKTQVSRATTNLQQLAAAG